MPLELEPLESDRANDQPATFEARKTKYNGPEHRHGSRRHKADRRALLRFELDNHNRRADNDRRSDNRWNNLYRI